MKILLNISAITAMLICAFCSCSKVEQSAYGDELTARFSVSLAETKAVSGEGSAINKVWFALYNTDGSLATNYAPVDFVNGSANCEIVMMRGYSYKVAFVAQHYKDGSTPIYNIDSETAVVQSPAHPVANSDKYDLFYGVKDIINYNGGSTGSIVLDRAVAMINFTCSDAYWNADVTAGTVPTYSSITLSGVADGWDIFAGKAVGTTSEITFEKAEIPAVKHLGAAFCFVTDNVNATLDLYDSDSAAAPFRSMSVSDVEVERNKKTNITIK